MKAKKKLIDKISIDDLGIDIAHRIKQIKVIEPSKRQKGIMVKDVAELIQKLKHEAKVI
jgi:electron transfer flavoprotein beta subunit